MAQAQYPDVGALVIANLVKDGMANSVIHLLQEPLSLTRNLSLADLEAKEANYDGYAPKTVAEFNDAYLQPSGGATTSSPLEIFYYGPAASPPVTNNIYGWWIENDDGVPVFAYLFDGPIAMQQVGDATQVLVLLNYGA